MSLGVGEASRSVTPHSSRERAFRLNKVVVALALPLLLIAMAACARIGNPEGWSKGAVVDGVRVDGELHDLLYIGTREGELIALDRTSGERMWRFELIGEEKERAIYGTPAVAGDKLYVGGYDSMLYVLSLDEGEMQARVPLGGPIVGGPVVVDNLVLVGSSDGYMYAFDTEKLIEEQVSTTDDREWRFATEGKVWSTPAVSDGVAYFGSLDHNVYAVDVEDGTKVWQFETSGAVTASPVVMAGTVYVGSFDRVFYAIDADTGDEVWRFDQAKSWYWSNAIATKDTVFAPSLDGNLYALDVAGGGLRWTLETDGRIVGSPEFVLDMIAVGSADGKVRMARLRDGAEKDACNIGEEIRTSLVERDGFVYFGARDHSIRALRIKPNGNPDEEWAHFTDKDDPLPRGRVLAC